MRYYKKPFSWELVDAEDVGTKIWGDFYRGSSGRLLPKSLYFVHVCGFRFVFTSLTQIREYREFYNQPLKPSFRVSGVNDGHGDEQSPFARLPLYLWQRAKRVKVVAALERAIREFAKE